MFEQKAAVAALSVLSNTVLTLLKLGVGLSIGSVSVVAEAIHSGVDLLASLIALVAVRVSNRPPDEAYPYGRAKVENVSGTVEAFLIFLAAGMIVWEAVDKLRHGISLPSVDLGLAVMGLSVLVNLFVSRQLFRVARRTESPALEADAYHLTTDIVTSAGVFLGLVAVRLTGWAVLDPLIAISVAALIVRAAWQITHRSFVDLLDRSLPAEERRLIAQVLNQHQSGVCGFHEIRTRKAGGHRYVDLHLLVDETYSVSQAHDLCDHLENDIQQVLHGPLSLQIHVEPCARDETAPDPRDDRRAA